MYQEKKTCKGITVHKVPHMAVQLIHEKDVVYQNVPNVPEIYFTRCFRCGKKIKINYDVCHWAWSQQTG